MDWYSNQSLTDSRCGRYCNRLSARFGGETPVCFTTTRVKTVFSLLPTPNFFGTHPDLKDVVSDLNKVFDRFRCARRTASCDAFAGTLEKPL